MQDEWEEVEREGFMSPAAIAAASQPVWGWPTVGGGSRRPSVRAAALQPATHHPRISCALTGSATLIS